MAASISNSTNTTRQIRVQAVGDAIARFRATANSLLCDDDPDLTPPTPPVLVASNVTAACADTFFSSMLANGASFVYDEATRDLVIVKVSDDAGNRASRGVVKSLDPFVDAHDDFIHRATQSNTRVFANRPFLAMPDYVVSPCRLPPGQRDSQPPNRVASPRAIIEIEYKHRSLKKLHDWATRLLGDPLVRAVVGILVYRLCVDDTFAMLAVGFERNAAGGDAAAFDIVSFGTRRLHHAVRAYIRSIPLAPGRSFRQLPFPPIVAPHAVGTPMPAAWNGTTHSITVSGAHVFWKAPAPAVLPLPDLVIDLWPILDDVAAGYH